MASAHRSFSQIRILCFLTYFFPFSEEIIWEFAGKDKRKKKTEEEDKALGEGGGKTSLPLYMRKTKAEIRLLVTSIPRIRDKEKGGRMFIYLFIGDDRTGSFPLTLL